VRLVGRGAVLPGPWPGGLDAVRYLFGPVGGARADAEPGLHPAYRADIDGLRAIAVAAVFAYHLQISWFRGGFVGVDIFFVISGYLIGSIIIGEAKRSRFSLARFYVRRIRRILPAFFAMVFCVFMLSAFLLFPIEYEKLSYSTLYSALSVSNIYFFFHSGYFDETSSTQPLLHTWSLAVEEQFYVAFPLLVMAVVRYAPRWLNASLLVLGAASLALSAHGAYTDPVAAFYLPHTRAWELLLGALVANQGWTRTFSALPRNLLALAGLAMIVLAITAFNAETPFPGAAALLPCGGAALVIAAGQSGRSLVGDLLSLRPAVFVGLISYSLYLWHWPLIFLQHTNFLLTSSGSKFHVRLAIVLCSVAAATLSWQFVEKPFRTPSKTASYPKVFTGGFLAMGTLAALALVVISGRGFPGRFSPMAVAYASYLDYGQAHFREGKCFIVPPYSYADFDHGLCLEQDSGRKNYLLIGDSHAAQLWYGLSQLLPDVRVLQATAAGCVPEFAQTARLAASCTELMDYMYKDYLVHNHVDRLLLAARWNKRDFPNIEQVLSWARQRAIPVTIFGPMVEYNLALPRVLAYGAQQGDPKISEKYLVRGDDELDRALRALAREYGAKYISLVDILCTPAGCATTAEDGSPLEFDTDHVTKAGSLLLIRKAIAAGQLS
jgi:peptidoglycan/LPS O-acetylase OafA/YrhL